MKLTAARRHALEALARVHPEPAHISNKTDQQIGYVYWQCARALVEHGLAGEGPAFQQLRLTDGGRRCCAAHGITVSR